MKNVIITGTSSGFGLKAAKDFADKGYKVFATMRNPNGKNASVKVELENHSSHIKVVDMDVTSDASVKEAMESILAIAGNIDILINNAGIMYLGITEAFSVEQAHFQMETNYYGAIRVMQAVLPSMRKSGSGLIINTSSLVGRISPPFFGTYTATKHALEGYSQALRYEVSPFGVDIVMVEPGPFGTGLLASGKLPAHSEVLETYGELADVPSAMGESFAQMLQSKDAPDPQWVVDAYLKLADMPLGKRPTRTVVGITWGVDEINELTQPIQDRILKEMQLENVLGGVSTMKNKSKEAIMNRKEIVGTFLGAVMKQDTETMRKFANADYIQHNPFVPTGLEPFIQLLPVLKEHGTYAENVRMFQDGNYVFMHNIWHNAKPFGHGVDEMVAFDIIRVDENGKVAEHWDAMTVLLTETASGRTQTDGPTTIEDLDKTEANKALTVSLIEDVLMGKNPSKIAEYISSEEYHQHNPQIKDGLTGIVEAVESLTSQNNMFKYTKIHKVLGEGNFVLTVSEGQWNGTTNAFYDLFRMKSGKIVEHWDVIQEVPTEGLANTNGMFEFNNN